jgi:hypothetical protein
MDNKPGRMIGWPAFGLALCLADAWTNTSPLLYSKTLLDLKKVAARSAPNLLLSCWLTSSWATFAVFLPALHNGHVNPDAK